MSVLSMPASRNPTDPEIEQLERLSEDISAQFAVVEAEDVNLAIAEMLRIVANTTGIDRCRLIEFDETGAPGRVHVASGSSTTTISDPRATVPEAWFARRLFRGQRVVVSRPDELPEDAGAAREKARRTRGFSLLGLPAPPTGAAVCALAAETSGTAKRWTPELIDVLQQIATNSIVALRRRREAPPRTDVAAITRLNARLEADNRYLKEEIKTHHDFEEIVGGSETLKFGLSRLAQVAPMNSTVLLLGPTGSGKELFARAIHERSRRHTRPLVRVNCAALPPTLVESELFGHEKGAFTGAVGMRQGRFEMADGGTIFLDEIGDLTPDVQVKFLRVLQEGEFERVGSSRTRKVDVRVIAATHHDLETAVAEGKFRADLYYRLSVYPIRLPSLAERTEDIPQLAWFFVNRHQRDLGRRITEIPQRVIGALQSHNWPGNVRELENVIVRAMIASEGDVLELDAPLTFTKRAAVASSGPPEHLDAVQRAHIESVLERCDWRINGAGNAADSLGLHPNTLRFRMKKLGLVRPSR